MIQIDKEKKVDEKIANIIVNKFSSIDMVSSEEQLEESAYEVKVYSVSLFCWIAFSPQ